MVLRFLQFLQFPDVINRRSGINFICHSINLVEHACLILKTIFSEKESVATGELIGKAANSPLPIAEIAKSYELEKDGPIMTYFKRRNA